MDALRAAVVEMVPNFSPRSHLDCRAGIVGSAKYDGVLSGGHDADVERYLPPINPVSYKDVGRTRAGARDETGHFLHRVEGCLLRLFIDFIPNSVMPATADAVVVLTMHGMIAMCVVLFVAVFRAAGPRMA